MRHSVVVALESFARSGLPVRALLALIRAAGGPGALGRHVVKITVAADVVVRSSHASAVSRIHLPLPEADSLLSFGQVVAALRNRLFVVVAVGALRVRRNHILHLSIDFDLGAEHDGTEANAELHLHAQAVLLGLSGLGRLRR